MNSKIDPKEFDPDFPPGFDVQDLVNNKNYLVLDNGTLHETELFRDMNVTSATAQESVRSQWVLYISIASVGLVVITLGFLIYRRKRVVS